MQPSKKSRWLLTGVAAIAATVMAMNSVASAGTSTPADPPTGSHPAVITRAPAFKPANVPSGGHETSYVSVAPCRLVDTAQSAAGIMQKGIGRTFAISADSNFTVQGGQPGGCGIPAQASAITASISGSENTGSGFLRAWANGTVEPLSVALLLVKNTFEFAGTTIPVSSSGIMVKTTGSDSRFVLDVTGYYLPKMYVVLGNDSGNPVFLGYSRINGVSHVKDTGLYTLFADTDVSSCAIDASSAGTSQAGAYASGSSIYVATSTAAGTLADAYFKVSVTC